MCGAMGQYTDVVVMPLDGRRRTIDRCIHHIVAALNAASVRTVASCCGHGNQPGRITLEDGRELMVVASANEAEQVTALLMTEERRRELCSALEGG